MYTLQSNARLPYTTQGSALDKMLCKVVMTCLWPCTARLQVHHGRCLSSGDTKFSGDSHLEVCCTYKPRCVADVWYTQVLCKSGQTIMILPLRNCLPEHKFRGESKTRNSATTAVTASHAKQHVSIRVASKLRPAIADYCLLILRTTLLSLCTHSYISIYIEMHTCSYSYAYVHV